jgi:hypothetical protein
VAVELLGGPGHLRIPARGGMARGHDDAGNGDPNDGYDESDQHPCSPRRARAIARAGA